MSDSGRPVLMVVDDDRRVAELVTRVAERARFQVAAPGDGRAALARMDQVRPQVAIVDLKMPEVDGLDVLRALRQGHPECQVVLMTGHASIETAVESIKLGALDYLCKPFDLDRLGRLLAGVREDIDRRRTLLAAEGQIARRLELHGMIGRSAVMQELFALIRRLAPHVRSALVTGETGTGKELVARALHRIGPRPTAKFFVVNCSAIVETLFESELFGHVRGSFTGATETKAGIFEAADGGTLFLDEIGELPPSVQGKLLRALEIGEVQRVGSVECRNVDVRVIGATNRNLSAEVDAGRFRSDLFYRLNVVEIKLPPLRERREDIPFLTAAFLREFSARFGKTIDGISPAAERLLGSAEWPGNVRELRNALERACILADGPFLNELDLVACLKPASGGPAAPADGTEDPLLLSTSEREHIRRVLTQAGNKKEAAQMLGISRRALYRRLDRLGLR